MSEAQPPPRIRTGLPFTLNSRWPLGVSSEVISLDAEAHLLAVGDRAVHLHVERERVEVLRRPCGTATRRAASRALSAGRLLGREANGACARCGASVDAPSRTARSRCAPRTMPLTGWSVVFHSSALTVRSARLEATAGRASLTTCGWRSAIGPLSVRYTSPHRPMFLSAGVGFQSTHMNARSLRLRGRRPRPPRRSARPAAPGA